MGQSIGRLIFGTQFNSGGKPDRMLEYKPSLPTESKEPIKKPSVDIKIIQKHQNITEKMETFITDTIILAKLRHYKDSNKMVSVIRQKLTEYNGGNWNIIFHKAESKLMASVRQIAFLQAIYDGFKFIVFQTSTRRGIWPTKLGNEGFFDKTESAKNFQQDELDVKIISKYFGMFADKTTFFIDTIILEKLRQPEDLMKMAVSIQKKAQEQYGGKWNVIIYDAKCAFDLKFQVETTKGSYINADYDGLRFYIFPNH
jgi:hypothetical protein